MKLCGYTHGDAESLLNYKGTCYTAVDLLWRPTKVYFRAGLLFLSWIGHRARTREADNMRLGRYILWRATLCPRAVVLQLGTIPAPLEANEHLI